MISGKAATRQVVMLLVLLAVLLLGSEKVSATAQNSDISIVHPKSVAHLSGASSEKDAYMHETGDPLDVQAISVSPFNNPWETYGYYTLPFCPPSNQKPQTKGPAILPFDIRFRVDVDASPICTQNLTSSDLARLQSAIKGDYNIEMSIDGLPLWAFLGMTEKRLKPEGPPEVSYQLYTHTHFTMLYHEGWLVEVDLSTVPARAVDISQARDLPISFSYSVGWQSTTLPFEGRMLRYTRDARLPQTHRAHLFGVLCAALAAFQLLIMLAKVVRTARKHNLIEDISAEDDVVPPSSWWEWVKRDLSWPAYSGHAWRHLQGDVFRPPQHPNLFAACVGVGIQLLCVAFLLLFLAVATRALPSFGVDLLQAFLAFHGAAAVVGGYVAGMTRRMMGGIRWLRTFLLTATLFFLPMLAVLGALYATAAVYHSTTALPLQDAAAKLGPWLALAPFLAFLGSLLSTAKESPVKDEDAVAVPQREIPAQPWYLHPLPQLVMAGFLPFAAVSVELHFSMITLWGHRFYTSYPYLAFVFVLMIVESATIAVIFTYVRLSKEDHRWWWKSFLCGGGISVFVAGYTCYYYFWESQLSGLLQTTYYLGLMGMGCYAVLLIVGAVSFSASLHFMGSIYSPVKSPDAGPAEGATVEMTETGSGAERV